MNKKDNSEHHHRAGKERGATLKQVQGDSKMLRILAIAATLSRLGDHACLVGRQAGQGMSTCGHSLIPNYYLPRPI